MDRTDHWQPHMVLVTVVFHASRIEIMQSTTCNVLRLSLVWRTQGISYIFDDTCGDLYAPNMTHSVLDIASYEVILWTNQQMQYVI